MVRAQPAEGQKWNFSGGEDAGDARLRRPPDAAARPGESRFHSSREAPPTFFIWFPKVGGASWDFLIPQRQNFIPHRAVEPSAAPGWTITGLVSGAAPSRS